MTATELDNEEQYFLVDWVLPALSLREVYAAQRALAEAARRLTEEGEPVRCVRSIYVSARQRWLCLVAATDAAVVRKAHEIAQIPVTRVDPAIELPVDVRQPT